MINHHPDDEILAEFCAGTLPLARSACVSMHLYFCEHCRRRVQRLQQVASAMFDTLTPRAVDDTLLDKVLSRLDEEPPLSYRASVASDGRPPLVQRLMKGDYEDLRWSRVNSALRISRLRTGDPHNELALYRIKAGGSIPRHGHRGTELTLVLEGSFSDEEGLYQQGDFIERDAEHTHTPTAARTADCICIGVLDAPIRFTPWNYRVLNPFLRLHAG